MIDHPLEAVIWPANDTGATGPTTRFTVAAKLANCRIRAMMDGVRQTLSTHQVCESLSADEEGYYFVIDGESEVSLHYHWIQGNRAATGASLHAVRLAFAGCCHEMARRGFTVTLFMSPRAQALHICE